MHIMGYYHIKQNINEKNTYYNSGGGLGDSIQMIPIILV